MNDQRLKFFSERMDVLSRRDRVFINNPVIMQGMGLAPIVIPATSIQNAIILAVGMALLLTPTRILATIIGQRTGFKFRAVLYAVTSGLVYVGVAFVMDLLFGTAVRSVGIYLGLLVLEPLVIKRYESGKSERLVTSFKKGIITTAGFCLALFITAGVREVLGVGTFAGVEVFRFSILPMASMPAGGFILLGLIAALWRGLVNDFKKRVAMGVKASK